MKIIIRKNLVEVIFKYSERINKIKIVKDDISKLNENMTHQKLM